MIPFLLTNIIQLYTDRLLHGRWRSSPAASGRTTSNAASLLSPHCVCWSTDCCRLLVGCPVLREHALIDVMISQSARLLVQNMYVQVLSTIATEVIILFISISCVLHYFVTLCLVFQNHQLLTCSLRLGQIQIHTLKDRYLSFSIDLNT